MLDVYLNELKQARAEMAELIEKYSGLEVADLLEAFAAEALTEDTPNE